MIQIVFGRTGVVILFLLLQALILLIGFDLLRQYIVLVFGGYALFGLLIAIIIINREENPAFQISWLIPVLLIPFFGGLLYLFVQSQFGYRVLHKRVGTLVEETRTYNEQETSVACELAEKNPSEGRLAGYTYAQGNYPVFRNTGVKYFPLGEDKFEEMLIQLEKAEHFIFLEYFIVEEGYMWGRVLEVLQRKVKQGVEVRMMYDGMCCLILLPYHYPRQLEALGIKCKMFAPIYPMLSTIQNNRDHRKILVIDGKVAFTGGVNLADEYINRKVRFGHWKDTAIMIEGEAVRTFTLMFLQMWNLDEKKEDYERYLNVDVKKSISAGYVIPYGDSPVDHETLAENIYLDIINRAVNYVHIMTPYLILDQELITALTFAAKRGVDVTIIMPHIPDKKYAFALAKTYYPTLLRAGVNIFEYTPGFVHAKVFTSDDERAVVGTVNLDYRSLYLHFECGVYLYQTSEIADIERDMQETLKKCQRVTLVDCKKEKLRTKIYGRVLRLFAPLM
ncbi:cardiolipin synthase [Novisyntrophococcus fermenticellae]|uniref:cardiolipin synthase n=1 Tax=Novisyntrophococcus fermenticellae TaxID=2068655 RepID=UPI001E34E459|nr:cardiolipin synthase [Novisyntrophococcus fermenticellae]